MTQRVEGEAMEGEILSEGDPGPRDGARRVRDPGWVGRNRDAIVRGQMALRAAMPFAPPPARLAMIAATLAAEGLLTVEDGRTGRVERNAAGLRVAGILLDGIGIAGAARIGPTVLVRHARSIAVLRAALSRMEREQPGLR